MKLLQKKIWLPIIKYLFGQLQRSWRWYLTMLLGVKDICIIGKEGRIVVLDAWIHYIKVTTNIAVLVFGFISQTSYHISNIYYSSLPLQQICSNRKGSVLWKVWSFHWSSIWRCESQRRYPSWSTLATLIIVIILGVCKRRYVCRTFIQFQLYIQRLTQTM